MAKDKIKFEFKDGKKIIRYPGGIIKEQTKKGLEKYKGHLTRRMENIDRQMSLVDKDLASMNKAKETPKKKPAQTHE